MKHLIRSLAITAGSVLAVLGASAQTPLADGQVTKIDKGANRIELRHGEIKHLDMPPMKMVFRVRDAKLLDSVAVGDKVRFAAEKVDGYYTVTAISKAP